MALAEGDRVSSDAGFGGIGPNHGIFRARCLQTGTTVFLVQVNGSGMSAVVRTLFPRYVEAEAEAARLGCGPLKLKLPQPAGSR
ncbi:hypothetical protein [Streptomyces sp. JB150]|uniref:hypothetical protein n=1 Tax=Streptomyces sp. JB150 TaxID=2714844 RepID=UPI00140D743D|nr:hypothetical protein [Streptomyces sp. JB150]QIJ60594.1 hypothetical protein G7Z13_22550 [Streptomyces sp. JB150]